MFTEITHFVQRVVVGVIRGIIIFALRFIVLPLVRLLWVRRVTGLEHIPSEGAAIIVLNHQSYFDFIGFVAVAPRSVHFLAAEKFYTKETHWIWGPVMDATGQIRVDRKSNNKEAVYKAVEDNLQQGRLIGIFPEGTRAPQGTEMLRGFTGATRFAAKSRVPLIPVGVKGAYEIMSRHDKVPRLKKILEFHIDKPIHLPTEAVNWDKDEHQRMTDSVMRVISKLSNKPYPYGE